MFDCQLMFFKNLEIIAERIWIMFKSVNEHTNFTLGYNA